MSVGTILHAFLDGSSNSKFEEIGAAVGHTLSQNGVCIIAAAAGRLAIFSCDEGEGSVWT